LIGPARDRPHSQCLQGDHPVQSGSYTICRRPRCQRQIHHLGGWPAWNTPIHVPRFAMRRRSAWPKN